MSTCPACGTARQPDAARFCYACGGGLGATACVGCGAEIVAAARFCSSCGAAQDAAAPPSPARPVASRRVTSVLFGDLVAFTSLAETRDQEAVRELLSDYFEACRQVVGRYGGTVEKFIGDAVMAVWGVPTAHEDDAERAVRAGLELVHRIESLGSDVGVPGLAMRVGIVTGEVAVTVGAEQQGMVAGDAVNTASRVQSAAEPGQVWVDETTRLLTTSAIAYVDVGSHALKGKAEPVPLWSVRAVVAAVGGAQRADGLESPLMGRGRELRLVKEIFHGVEESRQPRLLVVDGEPGAGKSRLGWEFEKYADGLSEAVRWHSGRCLSYGEGVAFFALAEAVRARLQLLVDDDDSDEDPVRLLAAGLERYVPDPAERDWLGPRLGALLGTRAVAGYPREDLFAAWTTFLERVGEDDAPVVLLVDDAQHADEGLLLFLEYLLAVAAFPCFVLLLTRPGLLEANPLLATNRRSAVLHLETLSDADMGAMLDGLVVGLPEDVRASLVERAEGVPLFAVETVRSLIDRDLVVPRGGQYVLRAPAALDLDAIGAPASLQALISARLDALTPAQRRVVDQASVLGLTFTRAAIAALCADVADIDEVLDALVRLQLLQRESNRFSNERGQYQFVQSAVRQVAYGTLSRRDRKASHLVVVGLLEAEPDEGGELAPVVAQHYLDALDAVPDDPDAADLAASAVAQLRRAAKRAAALGAPGEAAGHLSTALDRCADPALAAPIEAELAGRLLAASQYPQAIGRAAHAGTALDALGDHDRAAGAVAVHAMCLVHTGEFERAVVLVEERLRQAGGGLDPGQETELLAAAISGLLRVGRDFREYAERAACIAERVGDPRMIADSYVSLALHYTSEAPRALGRMLLEAAAGIAREQHEPTILCHALLNLTSDRTQDDARAAAQLGREALAAARTTGMAYWVGSNALNLVLALQALGAWDEALDVCDGADDEFMPRERVYLDLVRGRIRSARGEAWSPSRPAPEHEREEDPEIRACGAVVVALSERDAGMVPDLAAVTAALTAMYAGSGPFDDFTVMWQAGADLAWECGDHAALRALLALIDPGQRSGLPRGLVAVSERIRGLLLTAEAGGGTEAAERPLRAALAAAEAWNSRPTVGRCAESLGLWLAAAGRTEESAALLDLARGVYAELGAERWLAALDAPRVGVSA